MMDVVNEIDFFDGNLLESKYFKLYKQAYLQTVNTNYFNPHRNYYNLINSFKNIYEINENHAKSFAKRIRTQQKEWNDCEAVYCEVIVYNYYISLLQEGIVKNILMKKDDYDLKIEYVDGTSEYFEIFSVMPQIGASLSGETSVYRLKTHLQQEASSIRQKLLRKIEKQNQLKEPRQNYAIIELNDIRIADDFIIVSSLTGGYKVKVDIESMELMDQGYDLTNFIFNEPATRNIKGIIYFFLGNYSERRIIENPYFNRCL